MDVDKKLLGKIPRIQVYELLLSPFLSTMPSFQGGRVLVDANADRRLGFPTRSLQERERLTNWAQCLLL